MSNDEARPEEMVCRAEAAAGESAGGVAVEILGAREVPLGGPRAMLVRRTLPQRRRSLIGAWCFADHYGPEDVGSSGGMDVAPHPHTGLQTVSWLFSGEIAHIDSGGNRGAVRPGEVNLMTSGGGICHSETSTADTTVLHGVQLWLALPDPDREAAPRAFEHFVPPVTPIPGGELLVFLGALAGAESPVDTYTPVLGAELRVQAGREVELDVRADFEHGFLVDSGVVEVEGVAVPAAALAYTGVGAERIVIRNRGDEPARIVVLGGEPFAEEIIMWWNFVGRTGEEIVAFREQWQARGERFGRVEGYVGHGGPGANAQGRSWLPAPELPMSHFKARRNPPPHARQG